MKHVAGGILLCVAAATAAHAGEPVQELTLGTPVFAQAPLELQATVKNALTFETRERRLESTASLELGIFEGFQVELEAPVRELGTAGQPSELRAGWMWNVLPPGAGPVAVSVGGEAGASAPWVDEACPATAELYVVAHRQLGRLHLNLTGTVETALGALEPDGEATLSLFQSLSGWVPTLEVSVGTEDGLAPTVSAGLSHALRDGPEIAAAALVGRRDGETAWGGVILVTYELSMAGGDGD